MSASAARRRIAHQLSLAGLGGLLLLLALGFGPERSRQSPGQARLRAAVESASARLDAGTSTAEQEASSEGRVGSAVATGSSAPERSALWRALAARAHRLGGWLGVFSLQWSLCFLGLLAVWWTLASRLGRGGSIAFVAVALFGSSLAIATTWLVPELMSFLLVSLAGALVWARRAPAPVEEPEQIFQGEISDRRGLWRWAAAGLAFGLALADGPALLPLAIPLVAGARPGRRGGAAGLFAAGALAGFLVAIGVSGWPWPPLEIAVNPKLWGWNLAFLVAGRSLGLLPFFLPGLFGLLRPEPGEGRRWIPWAVLAGLVVLAATAPFDLAGDAGAPLLASFLPFYAMLLLLPSGALGRPALAAALLALPFLAPAWLDAAGVGDRPWARPFDRVRRELPLETTQRELGGVATLDRASGIVLRGLEPEVFAGGDGRLRLTGRRATLLVESAVPLASVQLELGAGAPSTFEIDGGELGDVLFRPNGDVAVEVRLKGATRQHPTWRSRRGAAVAVFDLELPQTPVAPIPFDLSQARPRGLGEEAP